MMPINPCGIDDAERMPATTRRAQSCGAWDIFKRKRFTPAAIIRAIISGESVAGPKVAMILVLRELVTWRAYLWGKGTEMLKETAKDALAAVINTSDWL